MNAYDPITCGAHLIGSIPLENAETVFRTVAAALSPYVQRIPDGETGERIRWIYFQRNMLSDHPAMEVDSTVPPFALYQWDGTLIRETPWLRFRPDVDPRTVTFHTGYAEAALDSYAGFQALQDEEIIPPGVKFQVCLPTPMATAYMYISPKSREAYISVYEHALMQALQQIVSQIPAHTLSIQWDVCQEVLVFEDYFSDRPADYQQQIFAELARLGDAVPEAVDMGYHLCYGSPADAHLVMPKDMAIMVDIVNGFSDAMARRIDFLHLPVPKDRTDAAYFRPLANLTRGPDTALYLGLIHYDDPSGDQARMKAAQAVGRGFGVASECGWGRTDPQRVPGLLASHRAAVEFMRVGG